MIGTLLAPSFSTGALRAQRPSGTQFEGRLDLVAARTTSVQAGLSANVTAGLYIRMGVTIAAGVARRGDVAHGAARAELTARFLMDPFREAPLGVYGIGGLSAMTDGFEGWRPRIVVGAGIESRIHGGRAIAAEVALGGGVRVAAVVRRARRVGR